MAAVSVVEERAKARRLAIRKDLRAKYPVLFPPPRQLAPPVDRAAIVLGRNAAGAPVLLPERPRLEHAHVIGTTGGGKSRFLEHCIRQDVTDGRGVCVVDPHGEHPASLYRSLLSWLKERGYTSRRTVHLIDPNAPSHTVGFNPLARPDAETDLSVIAGVTLEAFSKAWGGEDTTSKPTIERVLTATFTALAELSLTLVEAPYLLDRRDRHGLRAHAVETLADRYARDELQRLHELSLDERRRHDFDLEVVGPINRIARFVRPPAIRAMIGQTANVLDFRQALDEGHIILCNLSGGARVYERDADLLGRLLTRSLFFHAKRRRAPERPFFVYLDECHRYLSGDLENILAEARKYGIGAVLAHQWLEQLAVEGDNMLAAVRNATNLKVVFRIKDPKEAEELAHAVIPLNLEMPVRALMKPTVIGHRRIKLESESVTDQTAVTHALTETEGTSESHTVSQSETTGITDAQSVSVSENEALSASQGTSQARSSGVGESSMASAMMTPAPGVFGAPTIIGMSEGAGSMAHTVEATGTSAASARSSGSARSEGSSHAETTASTWSESVSRGTHRAKSVGRGETKGTGRTKGASEALEPIMATLPSAVHGKDNALYMAAQTLRNLPTGRAFVNYVGNAGMMPMLLTVPHIADCNLSAEAFGTLREHILSRSLAATPTGRATFLVAERERMLLDRGERELREPATYRVTAPAGARVQVEPEAPAGFRNKKKRPPKEGKGKS
jgi:hypothetical protein